MKFVPGIFVQKKETSLAQDALPFSIVVAERGVALVVVGRDIDIAQHEHAPWLLGKDDSFELLME